MTDTKRDPFKDLVSLQDRMNRLFSESVKRIKEFTDMDEESWSPLVDIFEMPDSFVLLAELPGVPKEMINVEVRGETLTISGERPGVEQSAEGSLYRSERRYGAFSRTFNLPVNVHSESVAARVVDGVLTVTIPKPAEDIRRVKVTVD